MARFMQEPSRLLLSALVSFVFLRSLLIAYLADPVVAAQTPTPGFGPNLHRLRTRNRESGQSFSIVRPTDFSELPDVNDHLRLGSGVAPQRSFPCLLPVENSCGTKIYSLWTFMPRTVVVAIWEIGFLAVAKQDAMR